MNRKTHREIISLLVPLLNTPEKQAAFVSAAFFGTDLTLQITVGGAARDVAVQMIAACMAYGNLSDGDPAILALLDEIQARVGGDKQTRIQQIIDDIPTTPHRAAAPPAPLATTTALQIDTITLVQFFYDAVKTTDWQRADQLLKHLEQRPDLPTYFKLERYPDIIHNNLQASTYETAAAHEYNVLRVMAENEPPESVWDALKTFWETFPGYDPDNLRRYGRDVQYAEIKAMLNTLPDQAVWDALLAFWETFPGHDPDHLADHIHRHDEGFLEALHRIQQTQQRGYHKLDLSGLALRAVPGELARLTHLQDLNLAHNELTQFPDVVTDLPALETLSLSDNALTTLPESIGYMSSLKSLRLNINQITDLPRAIGAVTTLQKLYLHHNPLCSLPPTITQLKQLEVLDLGNNHFERLPEAVDRLHRLTWLFLNENRFTEFPAVLLDMPWLRWVFLHGNQLTGLPADISRIHRLKWLSLSNNRLRDLPASLGNLTDLEHLAIRQNPLTELPPDVVRRGDSAVLAWLRAQTPPAV